MFNQMSFLPECFCTYFTSERFFTGMSSSDKKKDYQNHSKKISSFYLFFLQINIERYWTYRKWTLMLLLFKNPRLQMLHRCTGFSLPKRSLISFVFGKFRLLPIDSFWCWCACIFKIIYNCCWIIFSFSVEHSG